jgi:hypothetical protein
MFILMQQGAVFQPAPSTTVAFLQNRVHNQYKPRIAPVLAEYQPRALTTGSVLDGAGETTAPTL